MNTLSATVDPAAHRTIERLIHGRARLTDHGQAGELPGLHTENGRVLGVGPDKVGRAAAEWGGQGQAGTERRTRHVQTGIRLGPALGGTIRGTAMLIARSDGPCAR